MDGATEFSDIKDSGLQNGGPHRRLELRELVGGKHTQVSSFREAYTACGIAVLLALGICAVGGVDLATLDLDVITAPTRRIDAPEINPPLIVKCRTLGEVPLAIGPQLVG